MISSHPGIQSALRLGAYVAVLAVVSALTAWSAYRMGTTVVSLVNGSIIDGSGRAQPEPGWSAPPFAPDPRAEETADAPATTSVTSALSQLTSARASLPTAPRVSSDDPESDPTALFHNGRSGTYKTYCVRLCDGFYWPISFSTTSDRFDADAASCASACGSPARLFVHPIPGGGPATMVSLDGLPYASLKSAFLFRVRYDSQCRCRAQPWQEAATDRHKLFAAAEAAENGDQTAMAEALRLKDKIAEQNDAEATARDDAERTASVELSKLAETASLTPPERTVKRRRIEARPRPSMLRVGALDEPAAPKRGYIPASGSTGRAWTERVFGDN